MILVDHHKDASTITGTIKNNQNVLKNLFYYIPLVGLRL